MDELRAVVFDLDGVLVDTPAAIAAILVVLAGEHGVEIDHAAALATVGLPLDRVLAGFLAVPAGDAVVEAARATFRERFAATVMSRGPALLHPGVDAGLARLADAGLPLAVATSKASAVARAVLDGTGVGHRFTTVVGYDQVARGKPDPESGLRAAAGLGVTPADCAYVGDAPVDMAMARGAGMVPVGVSFGVAPAAELRAAGAGVVCASFGELVEHLLELRRFRAGDPRLAD
jgi:phosphoglycolate phosphatase